MFIPLDAQVLKALINAIAKLMLAFKFCHQLFPDALIPRIHLVLNMAELKLEPNFQLVIGFFLVSHHKHVLLSAHNIFFIFSNSFGTCFK